ncbi:MAG: metallophosphoesterase [Pseudomonadales bacterium]|nr:metallophosphoesterase [Pseudomonadales bacterium]
MQLTTISQFHAVFHEDGIARRVENLSPGGDFDAHGIQLQTLPDLGKRLSTFATVNDVHFGEVICGSVSGQDMGPVFSAEEEDDPYPEVMNAAAIEEIKAIQADAVLAKGDLTCDGTQEQYHQFLNFYHNAFEDRLHHVRGNHEAYREPVIETEKRIKIELEGVMLLMIDTVRPGLTGGTVFDEDIEWIGDISQGAQIPVLVFGHHQIWDPRTAYRSEDYFGIQPDESEKLIALVASQSVIKGYFSGHTHRNRVRYFTETADVPWVEVACVKDFPGMWAEYQVFERGILQMNHRINHPKALEWSEKTKDMYHGSYHDYALGSLSDRCFVVCRN